MISCKIARNHAHDTLPHEKIEDQTFLAVWIAIYIYSSYYLLILLLLLLLLLVFNFVVTFSCYIFVAYEFVLLSFS